MYVCLDDDSGTGGKSTYAAGNGDLFSGKAEFIHHKFDKPTLRRPRTDAGSVLDSLCHPDIRSTNRTRTLGDSMTKSDILDRGGDTHTNFSGAGSGMGVTLNLPSQAAWIVPILMDTTPGSGCDRRLLGGRYPGSGSSQRGHTQFSAIRSCSVRGLKLPG